jgi:hypothetical protein
MQTSCATQMLECGDGRATSLDVLGGVRDSRVGPVRRCFRHVVRGLLGRDGGHALMLHRGPGFSSRIQPSLRHVIRHERTEEPCRTKAFEKWRFQPPDGLGDKGQESFHVHIGDSAMPAKKTKSVHQLIVGQQRFCGQIAGRSFHRNPPLPDRPAENQVCCQAIRTRQLQAGRGWRVLVG